MRISLHVELSESELDAIGLAAARNRTSVSEWVRRVLLDRAEARARTPTRGAAVGLARCLASVEPMTKDEALGMEGAGWDGDLEEARSGDPGEVW